MVFVVGPRTDSILQYYLGHLSMVARAGIYCSTPLKGHQVVTPGDSLSSTTMNMVVYAVVCLWVTMTVGDKAGLDGSGRVVQWMGEFFYTNDVIFASPIPSRLQAALDVLTVLFDMVSLNTSVEKTVVMVFQPCHIVGGHLETEYMRWMTGVGG